MKGSKIKRVFAASLSAALFTTMSIGSFAASITYDVPTSPMTVDESLITCAAHAQADATPEVLGLTNTTDRASEVPADYNLSKAQSSVLIGTFGTDINSNPNPYLYNWAYNSWAAANGKELADKHTLGGISGNPNSVDTEIIADLGTVRSLYYRPDILIGTNVMGSGSDYNTLVADLPENKDDDPNNDYNPYIVTYSMSVCDDFLTTLYELAGDCKTIMEADSSRTMRYGDPVEIADQLTEYTVGIQSFILKKLAEDNAQKKTVAIFDSTQSANGVFYCVDSDVSTQGTTTHSRVGEFMAQTTVNVASVLGKESCEITTDRGNTACYSLTAEEIVANADIIITGGVQVNGNQSEDKIREMLLEYLDPSNKALINKVKNMPVMSSSFSTVGTIGANSIENLLGMAYWPAYCYPEYINPVYAATYWYKNFYHVTDNKKLATIIDSTMSTASKPNGITTDISGYSETVFQSLIDEGMNYYWKNRTVINNNVLNAMASHLNEPELPDNKADKFTDVTPSKWFYSAVANAVEKGLFNGTTETTFSPDDNMTRAMFGAVLYRMENSPSVTEDAPFEDIRKDQYFYNGVAWAYKNKIVNGTSATTYSPYDNITREQIAVMFYRTAALDGKDTSLSGNVETFPDASRIDSYAQDAMKWAVGHGLIKGSDGNLLPRDNATRAQVAQMFLNYQSIN